MIRSTFPRLVAAAGHLAAFAAALVIAAGPTPLHAQPVSQWAYDVNPATGNGRATYPGDVKVNTLAGVGSRCLQADASGGISAAAGGCGGLTNGVASSGTPTVGQIPIWTAGNPNPTIGNLVIGSGLTLSAGTLTANAAAVATVASYTNSQASAAFSNGASSETLASTSTWQTMILNTAAAGNNIAGASLASNQVSLPAGTYHVSGAVPFYSTGTNFNFCRLQNITDATTLVSGLPIGLFNPAGIPATLFGNFTLAATKSVAFQCFTTNTTGQKVGPDNNTIPGGGSQVFESISFEKVS